MSELSARVCVACRGDTPALSGKAIETYLELVDGWTLRDGVALEQTFTFKNFKAALDFFNRVAAVAEMEDHHPDMGIYQWKKVKLSFTTHVVRGLTDNDFVMAAKVDQLLRL